MKNSSYQKRFYRQQIKADGLSVAHIVDKETDLQILTDKPIDRDFVAERIRLYRWDIERYIDADRRFLSALKPLEVDLRAPLIVKEMSQAARLAGVGPMSAVAGALAQFLGRDLLKKGYKDVIIENGGDIFIKTRSPRSVGVYAGRSKLLRRVSLKIKAKDTPLGVCTSSGTLGHSLSFGRADSVVILSKSVSLADAAATAVANRVSSKSDLEKALDFARSIKGVSGVAIILKNDLIAWGRVEFIK